MKDKLSFKEILLMGSLLFGLFFGAGNLIFPVYMGQLAGENVLPATLGFLFTGVGLPILGVVASALSGSDSLYEMAKPISRAYSVFFTCALYLTIGPLFAIPRTATVAFEVGLNPFIAAENLQSGLLIFSGIFFAITLYFSLRPGRILDWVGKYLTPAFLILLSILVFFTLVRPMGNPFEFPAQGVYSEIPLFKGLVEGYNTMDALASLAFAIIIITNIERLGVTDRKRKAIEIFKSGIVCLIGMSLVYASLSYMGATSLGSISPSENGGAILSKVSEFYLATPGKILLAGIVTIACLKTAIGLITACAQMFSELFKNSLSYNGYAIVFTLASFIIANFGLTNIIQMSIPVLMFLYPLAITLIILCLLIPIMGLQRRVFISTTIFTFVAAIFDLLNALPDGIKSISTIQGALSFATKYLPGFELGFGWVLPAVIGFILGLILTKMNAENKKETTSI